MLSRRRAIGALGALWGALVLVAADVRAQREPDRQEIDATLARLGAEERAERLRLITLKARLLSRAEADLGERLSMDAATLAKELGTPAGRAQAEFVRGLGEFRAHRNEAALAAFGSAVSAAHDAGSGRFAGLSAIGQAMIQLNRARIDEAAELLEEARPLIERAGTDLDHSWLLNEMARLHHTRFELEQALDLYLRALEHSETAGVLAQQANQHYNIGAIQANLQDTDAALASYRRALELTVRAGLEPSSHLLFALGQVSAGGAEPARTHRYFAEGLAAARAEGNPGAEAFGQRMLGELAFDEGRIEEALEHFGRSLEIVRDQGNAEEKASSAILVARAQLALGDVEAAAASAAEARRHRGEIEMPVVDQEVFRVSSEVFEARGKLREALDAHRRYAEVTLAMESRRRDQNAMRRDMKHRLEMERRERAAELARQSLEAESRVERQALLRNAGLGVALVTALFAVALARSRRSVLRLHGELQERHAEVNRTNRRVSRLNEELEVALGQVKRLSGLLPICCVCKKIRDDRGSWSELEVYIDGHSEATFSHGLCPDCTDQYREEHGVVPKDRAGPDRT